MSLIVAVIVPTGIVMSGDSRTSFTPPSQQAGTTLAVPVTTSALAAASQPPAVIPTGLIISDSTYKVFLLHNRFGVSTCGASLINGMPVAHHVESFELQHVAPPNDPHVLATQLLGYFRAMTPIPQVSFQVAGYDASNESHIEFINVGAGTSVRVNATANQSGAWWVGDIEIASRLAQTANVAWDSLNVQDAIDYSRHLIRSTIDQMRFELRFPTVGGPIDTLLLSPKQSTFLSRKEPRCQ